MKQAHPDIRLDDSRILAAIAAADAKTTGEVRVMISRRKYPDPLSAARMHFKVLKLDKPPHRNVVLIFVAPKSKTFAVYGDAAMHVRLGPEFWNSLRDEMGDHFKGPRFTDALVQAITRAGEQLAIHLPRNPPETRKDSQRI